jgi:predicted MFS family arabinose efflux permease
MGLALALSLAAAVSLGITRFAYGLLLPVMRADLAWSYTLAGAMNTANAAGYLLGALATPRLLQRLGAVPVLLGGALLASLFMGLSGFFTGAAPLLLQRLLAGVASAPSSSSPAGCWPRVWAPCCRSAAVCCWACTTVAPAGASRSPRWPCRRC